MTAHEVTEHAIIQAEQFKAQVAVPTGMVNPLVNLDNDDNFFHVTCHIEETLKSKIERGEYVDLERLLPKDKWGGKPIEDNKLEIFSKDGVAYFASTGDRSSGRISGLCKWEQAF